MRRRSNTSSLPGSPVSATRVPQPVCSLNPSAAGVDMRGRVKARSSVRKSGALEQKSACFQVLICKLLKTKAAEFIGSGRLRDVVCFHRAIRNLLTKGKGLTDTLASTAGRIARRMPLERTELAHERVRMLRSIPRSSTGWTRLKSLLMRNSLQVVEIVCNLLNLSRSY